VLLPNASPTSGHKPMPEKSTTPDLVERTRDVLDAASRHDLDAAMGFYAPDAVWDLTDAGLGTIEGVSAIRSFVEDWWGTWANYLLEVEETVDLGQGVVFSSVREDGRLAGSDRHVEQRVAFIFLWAQGVVERQTVLLDIGLARAAAERLAKEGG
jgi:ketosteroid isomerase-like protein